MQVPVHHGLQHGRGAQGELLLLSHRYRMLALLHISYCLRLQFSLPAAPPGALLRTTRAPSQRWAPLYCSALLNCRVQVRFAAAAVGDESMRCPAPTGSNTSCKDKYSRYVHCPVSLI